MAESPTPIDTRRRAMVLAASLTSVGALAWAARKPVTHTVVMEATAYTPIELTVQRGDTVVWVNKDPFPHTVTCAGEFDSGSIADAASWAHRPRKAGRFDYTCTFHPNMKATLVVI